MKKLNLIIISLVVAFSVALITCKDEAGKEVKIKSATLSPKPLEMKEGDAPRHLQVTFNPPNTTNQELQWESTRTGIATVSQDGMVTPVAEGDAFVVIYQGDKELDRCRVIVHTSKIALIDVTLSPNPLTMTVGDDARTLQITYNPPDASNKEIRWESTDDGIITVTQNGEVSPVEAGEADVVVYQGERELGRCRVYVNAGVIELESATLSSHELTMTVGDAPQTLQVTFDPLNATNQELHWDVTVAGIVTVTQDGVVTPVAKGETYVVISQGETEFDRCKVTVKSAGGEPGPNLLVNGDFESGNLTSWVIMTQAELETEFGGLLPTSPTGVGTPNILSFSGDPGFYNNRGITPKGNCSARLTAPNHAGIYQEVDVQAGKTYQYRFFILRFTNNMNQHTPHPEDKFKIKDAVSGNDLETVPVDISRAAAGAVANWASPWQEITGTVPIPTGVTKIKFLFMEIDWGDASNPSGRGMGMLIDDCEFCELQ